MKEALFYKQLEGDKVQCQLCPWNCHISSGYISLYQPAKLEYLLGCAKL